MDKIFLAVVVPGTKTTYPKVPPVLGPYHPSETEAMERGKRWLELVHKSTDVREVTPESNYRTGDPDVIRAQVYNAVRLEWEMAARGLDTKR